MESSLLSVRIRITTNSGKLGGNEELVHRRAKHSRGSVCSPLVTRHTSKVLPGDRQPYAAIGQFYQTFQDWSVPKREPAEHPTRYPPTVGIDALAFSSYCRYPLCMIVYAHHQSPHYLSATFRTDAVQPLVRKFVHVPNGTSNAPKGLRKWLDEISTLAFHLSCEPPIPRFPPSTPRHAFLGQLQPA